MKIAGLHNRAIWWGRTRISHMALRDRCARIKRCYSKNNNNNNTIWGCKTVGKETEMDNDESREGDNEKTEKRNREREEQKSTRHNIFTTASNKII